MNSVNKPSLCSSYCLAVIRAVIQGQETPAFPESLSLGELYGFAKFHNVEAMVFHGLCQLDMDFEDALWQSWENHVSMLLAQSVVQLNDRDLLFKVLTDAGIPLLPVKGCWLKEQYPSVEYRQMSDLDMLIPPEKAQEAKKIMLSLGYSNAACEDYAHHAAYQKPPYTEVELHIRLVPEDGGYYDNVWSRVQKVEGYPCLYRFFPEDEYIFYLMHLNRHLEGSGTGIRSVLDCMIYREIYPDMDQQYLKKELEHLQLWEIARQIEMLSNCWFKTGTMLPRELSFLAESILAAGSYGTVENYSRKELEKLQSKYRNPIVRAIVYWIIRICRPQEEMTQSYPLLKKLPVLLPVFWLVRAAAKFGKHPREIWNHVTLVFGRGKGNG